MENLEENNCDVRNRLIRKSRNENYEQSFGKIISIIVGGESVVQNNRNIRNSKSKWELTNLGSKSKKENKSHTRNNSYG